ncbi:cryptochrome/photolyase family protein [Haloarchaeobius iranensis]|uniref:Deoxyribodipyrimidine photo-lyase type I n=1 Tax=Haloarchaeobius iranensis TaxID=996166 RepID=A0A1G9W046_9EURY|nr:deoxyribodipyrimidine photo-lyase [Haloarchaeobius iranensis]SDM77597.1 deoxyribodipyrimidine photo-lyase type I [Haloarchaeobius iranensis]
MQLHWHRDDLRVADNLALSTATDRAAERGPVAPVFVFDDDVLAHGSPNRVAFMLDALSQLREAYRDRGSDLLVRHGDPREVLPALATELGAVSVTWAEGYSGLANERDAAVRQRLDAVDVARESVTDALHHEPGSITTNDGDPYSVYTYFWKKWRDRPKADPVDAPEAGALADAADLPDPEPLPTLADLGFAEPTATIQPAGTEAARDRVTAFCDGPVYDYAERRDYPADGCTSRLSADLKWGTIGIREVYEETAAAADLADSESDRESVQEFQSQLAWREFYHHVLFFNPEVVSANYKEYEHPIEWRNDPAELQAWKDGETGYPIVDAGMRQLREEGYMHNRVRMIVASFLTKDLLVDWREGYAHFREHLVDHDTANDNGGWQWAASTGTDAQPYFRIFNPMTQGERYDPDAEYITEYVPELRDADPSLIHGWHEASELMREQGAPEYARPIVDHGERREQALAMFKSARGEE